jgi:hypothetical protein
MIRMHNKNKTKNPHPQFNSTKKKFSLHNISKKQRGRKMIKEKIN